MNYVADQPKQLWPKHDKRLIVAIIVVCKGLFVPARFGLRRIRHATRKNLTVPPAFASITLGMIVVLMLMFVEG